MFFSRRSMLALASAAVVGTTAAVAPAISSAAPATGRAVATTSAHATARNSGNYTSRVFGTWRNGTVRGSFVPVRSLTRNHQTFVQGNLTAKVRRASGKLVGVATRRDLTIPVKAPGAQMGTAAAGQTQQATCSVLHLVLGPLNLNLLGLRVHLNTVRLNITAIPGAGNLLGNLLCAVTHLLDNTSPSLLNILQLSNVLNRIIGSIS
jgi:hypothetical protein